MKRALVLSGGAARGAFQAGFLYRNKEKYDLIAGVSAGALNGAMVAQGKTDDLRKVWLEYATNPNAVFKSKAIRQDGTLSLWGILREAIARWPMASLASSDPLKELIEKFIIADDIKTPLIVGATSLSNFEYHAISSERIDEENFYRALLASSSFPVVFAPVYVCSNYELYGNLADGGISGSSLSDAVNWIRNNDAISEWHIDIISTYRNSLNFRRPAKNIIESLYRTARVVINEARKRDLKLFIDRNKMGRYKDFSYRVIKPSNQLPANWDFTAPSITQSWSHGVETANKLQTEQ